MSAKPRCSTLVVSIDLSSADESQRDSTSRSLVALTARHGMACTWSSTNPTASTVVADVLAAELDHEIAFLPRTQRVADSNYRRDVAGEVAQHLLRAQSAGYYISTLALPCGAVAERLEALQKLGITAIRTIPAAQQPATGIVSTCTAMMGSLLGKRPPVASPRALRYRLWEVPATWTLPDARGRAPRLGAMLTAIDRAVAQSQAVQFAIDVSRLECMGTGGLKLVDKVFQHAARWRSAGELRIETVNALVDRLACVRPATPARSILRMRAA